jgi:hypothetical protein
MNHISMNMYIYMNVYIYGCRSQINQWMTEAPLPLIAKIETPVDGDKISEGTSQGIPLGSAQGVPLGSSSSTADFLPAVEAMTIHIELTGSVGLSSNKISLTFLPLATILGSSLLGCFVISVSFYGTYVYFL